jgi:hypothetical protein
MLNVHPSFECVIVYDISQPVLNFSLMMEDSINGILDCLTSNVSNLRKRFRPVNMKNACAATFIAVKGSMGYHLTHAELSAFKNGTRPRWRRS